MLRLLPTARRQTFRSAASSLAMLLALGGGAVLGAAVTGAPAIAQEAPDYSDGFVKAYQPVADIANATPATTAPRQSTSPTR